MTEVSALPPPPARKPPSQRPEDEFTEVSNSIDRLQVDGSDLAAISQYLAGVSRLAQLVKQMAAAADRAARTDDLVAGPYSSLGSHEIQFVSHASARLMATERAMAESLTRFGRAVDDTAKAVTRIAKDYQDTDKRNKLNAEQVQKFLKG